MSGHRKFRGKIVNAPDAVDKWITTDEIAHVHLLQAVEQGEIEEASLGIFSGYLDIYGKGIFTGDIVEDRSLEEYEVVSFRHEFVLDDHCGRYKTFATVGNEVKVIGNINDNPEIFD